MGKGIKITVKNRITAAVLAFFIVASFISVLPYSAALISSDWEYSVDASTNTATITKYNGSAADVSIPGNIDGYTVTTIQDEAFYYCKCLTSIVIPKSVTSLSQTAFENCTSLTDISVNESNPNYSSIDGVLYNKDKTELIRYPEGKPSNFFVIPNNVTVIGRFAFYNCSNLINITIPDSVKAIDECAFWMCNIKSIGIPSSVTDFIGKSVYSRPFWYASELAEIIVDKNNPNYSSLDGVLYNKDKTELICYPDGKSDPSFSIPDTVTTIGRSSFAFCWINSIDMPSSVTTINLAAFSYSAIDMIEIPESVTQLENEAFFGSYIKNIIIRSSVVKNYVFSDCRYLKKVYIKNPSANIEQGAFYGSLDGRKPYADVYIKGTENTIGDVFNKANVRLLDRLSVVTPPTKQKYSVGDTAVDPAGLTLNVCYDDGEIETDYGTLTSADCTFSGFDSTTEGTKTVTVTYSALGLSGTFDVQVAEKQLMGIRVTKKPDKTIYKMNEELDPTGLEVMAEYDDGSEEAVTGYTLSDLNSATTGEKTITVTYDGKTADFKVEVERTLTAIKVTKKPDKLVYKINDTLDTKGLEVVAEYDDGSEKAITGYTLGDFSSETTGEKTITVTYDGKTADFTVGVIKTLTGIRVTKAPDKLTYKMNENLDAKGLKVTADYDDGTHELLKPADYTLDGFDSTAAGVKPVTVTHQGKAASFSVNVEAPPQPQAPPTGDMGYALTAALTLAAAAAVLLILRKKRNG